MESKKRITAWIMLISLVIAGMNTSETGRKKAAAAEQAGLSSPVIKDGVTTWDTVYFGSYMQRQKIYPEAQHEAEKENKDYGKGNEEGIFGRCQII